MTKTPYLFLTSLVLAPSLHASVNITYDSTASDPANGTYWYNTSGAAGTGGAPALITNTTSVTNLSDPTFLETTVFQPHQVRVQAKQWDDSVGAFITNPLTAISGNNTFSLNNDLDPGDYLCMDYSFWLNGVQYYMAPADGNQLATSLNLESETANHYDDVVMVYDSNNEPYDSFFPSSPTAVNLTQNMNNGNWDSAPATLATGFGAIDGLTSDQNFDFSSPPTFIQDTTGTKLTDAKAVLTDGSNFPTSSPNSLTSGYTWYLGNTGSNTIAAGSVVKGTIDGALTLLAVPEPSRTLLLGAGLSLVLVRRRRLV